MKNTVFVLGAGSSMGYKFPSGQQLVNEICLGLKDTDNINQLVNPSEEIDGKLIERFRSALYYSEAPSVDLFLGKNQQFLTVGKRAIAQALLKYEIEENLFSKTPESTSEHWYRMFFNQLIRSFDMNRPDDVVKKLGNREISFITFNYDRSLEHYVFQKMKHLYTNWDDLEIASFVSSLNIIHVYGQLGFLNWQNKEPVRAYANSAEKHDIRRYSDSIRVIYEKTGTSEVATKCRDAINNAARIFFLGFGYHQENMDLIGIKSGATFSDRSCNYFGTSKGLIRTERERVSRYFRNKFRLRDNHSILDLLSTVNIFE